MPRSMITVVGLAALVCGLVSVSAAVVTSIAPAVETSQGISYVSGGIGQQERAAMRTMRQDYNVQLLFATTTADYLAEVPVMITDHTGKKVLEAVSHGPWFYVDLPAGQYHITAQTLGASHTQVVQVDSQKPTHLAFYWGERG